MLAPSPLARLAYGAALPLRAVRQIAADPVLRRWSLVPVALTVAGLTVGALLLGPASRWLLELVWPEPATALAEALWWLSRVAVYLLLLFVAAVALPVVAAAPACEALSARVEARELGALPRDGGMKGFAGEAVAGIGQAAGAAALLVAGHLVLLLLLLVPVVAGAYPALAFLWTARWIAFEYVGLPMARDRAGFGAVERALRAARPAGMGLGAALALLFLVPFANLLVIPVGAVAGTLLYCDLVRAGLVARRGEPAPGR